MQYLLDAINALANWSVGLVTWACETAWSLILGACALVLLAIPVPSWLANAGNVIGQLPPGVAYLAQAFKVPEGLAILVGAYTIRFVIRRIPLIG